MLKVSKESVFIGIKKIFPVENIIIFILAFFVSNIPGVGYEEVKMIFPFTIGILAASISAEVPFIIVALIGLIGTIINLNKQYKYEEIIDYYGISNNSSHRIGTVAIGHQHE